MKRIHFFNAWLDPLTMEETLRRVQDIIQERKPEQHVVINVAKLVLMQKNKELRDIVNSCGLINADGQGIVWGARLLGLQIPERVTGIDLFMNIVKLADRKNYKVYFLGAKETTVKRVVDILSSDAPGLQAAGCRNGYFSAEEEKGVAEAIRDSGADILFVAMSSPKKEFFLKKYLDLMQVPFTMGVGGSFDVVAGETLRAPLWMQQAGLEWFFRFLNEPGRMWKRYLVTNAIFFGMLLKALISGKGKYCE